MIDPITTIATAAATKGAAKGTDKLIDLLFSKKFFSKSALKLFLQPKIKKMQSLFKMVLLNLETENFF